MAEALIETLLADICGTMRAKWSSSRQFGKHDDQRLRNEFSGCCRVKFLGSTESFGRVQAEIPLIALSKFPRPALRG
jgi:hypothetical protein